MFLLAMLFGSVQRRKEISMMKETRVYLLSLDDRLLEDAGFSRELLNQGIKAWPWKNPELEQTAEKTGCYSSQNLKTAAAKLRSFSDKDLKDLGVSRGEIEFVVEHGRAGFDVDRHVSAA